jgi:hypothetical protein
MKRIFCIFAAALLGASCASHNPAPEQKVDKSDRDKLLDGLTLFVEAVQGDRIDKAMQYLDPTERYKFESMGGAQNPLLLRRLKAVRLSTLAHRPTVRMGPQGLAGIFDELPSLNTDTPRGDSVTATTAPRDSQ